MYYPTLFMDTVALIVLALIIVLLILRLRKVSNDLKKANEEMTIAEAQFELEFEWAWAEVEFCRGELLRAQKELDRVHRKYNR